VLGNQRQPDHKANQHQPYVGWRLGVAVERINRGQQEAGAAGVGRHKCRMSEQRGIEGNETESNEAGTGAEHFLRGQKHHQCQQDRDHRGSEANTEQDSVRVITEQGVPASSRFFKPVRTALKRGHLELHIEQRKGAKKLDQWRVLRVEPEVSMLRLHVCGVNMIRLVPGSGVHARHQRELQKDDRKQGCHGRGKQETAESLSVHGPAFLSNGWTQQLCHPHQDRRQL